MSKKSKKNKGSKKPIIQKAKKAKSETSPTFWQNRTLLLSAITAVVITLFCFYNTTDYDFVNWDDDRNFYEKEYITTINKNNF